MISHMRMNIFGNIIRTVHNGMAADRGQFRQSRAVLSAPRRRASWSSRIAVPFGYGSSYEPFASFTPRAGAMGGAPIGKSLRIDGDAQDDMAVGFETRLHFLGHSLPLLPVARHFDSIREDF